MIKSGRDLRRLMTGIFRLQMREVIHEGEENCIKGRGKKFTVDALVMKIHWPGNLDEVKRRKKWRGREENKVG